MLERLGYQVDHADDITERDIRIGWSALDNRLSEREDEFRRVLGDKRVSEAHTSFEAKPRPCAMVNGAMAESWPPNSIAHS